RIGPSDADQFLVFHELQYWNAALFGLAKQWSPVMCSGLSLAGEPQVPFASLPMLLGYLLGPLTGIVAGNLVYLAIGWLGACLYAGLWLPERALRALAASLFIGNGFFVCRLAHGHLDFIPFLALPLALWVIHRCTDRTAASFGHPAGTASVALLGCLFALVIDGSPVAIIHWLTWIGLYSLTLSWVRRSSLPALVFMLACVIAAVLDAGYLWPMLTAQADFPRHTADTFTGPWSLAWFMLIPMRGKLLPANGTGIELSVFIGPVLCYLIWRYRRILWASLPRDMKMPLLLVSAVSVWLGMGSLHLIHVPLWLDPFDWLRPLPGFRSMNVTGRFWGFLALPLSLLAAVALWRYVSSEDSALRRRLVIAGALALPLLFQAESTASAFWPSRRYEPAALEGLYVGKPEKWLAVRAAGTARRPQQQGELISPVRAVIDCYDMDDFVRADARTGSSLIQSARIEEEEHGAQRALQAGFLTWNRIRISPSGAFSPAREGDGTLRIVLNQAYHPGWSSADCALERGPRDNLMARCSAADLAAHPVDLVFFDPVSDLGTRVSVRSWLVLMVAMTVLGLLTVVPKRRDVAGLPG
ncbi:MAG TPA: hypothetical protein VLX90_08030, partial [Steroidobacteraceae bacterium]|nr:hypothetical protein [Steroidobacteraceae bacterium]